MGHTQGLESSPQPLKLGQASVRSAAIACMCVCWHMYIMSRLLDSLIPFQLPHAHQRTCCPTEHTCVVLALTAFTDSSISSFRIGGKT